ncbi:MAG: DUF305 domain-containing protein, partial [Vicinamibacterales bacterium]
ALRLVCGAAVCAMCLAGAACRTATPATQSVPIVQPGAPGQPSLTIDATRAVDLSRVRFTPADVDFMQGMISHHAQAIEMTDLLATRTERDIMRKLAERIDISQADEIKMMQQWLVARGQIAPEQHAHHHESMMMPGMLTPEQMARLAAAHGTEFDRLFLQGMIAHHQGALTMVDELMKIPGAAQESEIFGFVSDVEADQSAEIARMGAMLQEFMK